MRVISLELAKSSFSTRGFITRKGEFGEKIQVLLYNNGVKIDFTKEQPEIMLKGLNSKHEYAESTVSIENGKAVLTMDQDWNAVSGTFETAYFEVIGLLSGENVQLSTVDVDWYVLPEADISEGQEAVYVKKLEEVLIELQNKADTFLEELSMDLEASESRLKYLENILGSLQVDIASIIEELHAADFYTKPESDARFALKGETGDSYTKAESDARFASLSAIEGKADNTEVVHLTGDETIGGQKTFTERVVVSDDVPETPIDFGEGFESYAGQSPIFYKQNGRVYIEGACRPIVTIPQAGGPMFLLPEGCRPSTPRSVLCQGSGTNVWCLTIEVNGLVKVLRYRPTNSTSAETDIPAGAWLPFVTSFKAAE